MQSIKFRIIAIMLVLVFVSIVTTAVLGLINSDKLTDEIVMSMFEDQLNSNGNIFIDYMEQEFGKLKINQDGQLADESGRSISGRFEKLDQITSKMNSVATIFSKSGDDFVRVITNIKNDNGERAIETTLNKEGLPYKPIRKL